MLVARSNGSRVIVDPLNRFVPKEEPRASCQCDRRGASTATRRGFSGDVEDLWRMQLGLMSS